MTHCTWILALLAALVLGACGGGGEDVAGAGGAPDADSTTLTDQERIQAILQGCAASSTDELLALFQVLAPFLDTSSTAAPPGLTITGVNLLAGTIDWALDVENNGSIDATGTAGFRTAADTPYIPLSLLTLLTDISGLPAVIAALPDGTILRTSFNMTRGFTATGSADVSFANPDGTSATPSTSTGTVTISQPDCSTRYTWTDVAVPDLSSGTLVYPNTVVAMEITSGQDTVTGTVAFDGTSTATIDTALQGSGTAQQFLFDLETGTLTAVP